MGTTKDEPVLDDAARERIAALMLERYGSLAALERERIRPLQYKPRRINRG